MMNDTNERNVKSLGIPSINMMKWLIWLKKLGMMQVLKPSDYPSPLLLTFVGSHVSMILTMLHDLNE